MYIESVFISSSRSSVGVKVPVQVLLSWLIIVEREPLGLVLSAALEKEITASENSRVTVMVSPIVSNVSEIVKKFTEGALVSNVAEMKVSCPLWSLQA